MSHLRVLIVDDSLTVRRLLVEGLEKREGYQVVGEAKNGQEAFGLCQRLRPDVVTMDLMMPGLDGLEATRLIMAHCPTPIVILSAAENRTEGMRTLDALAAGALDAVDKPSRRPPESWLEEVVDRVREAARVRVIPHPKGPPPMASPPPVASPLPVASPRKERLTSPRLVVMGASTGGPAAVSHVLQALPADFPLPVLLVLHVGAQFDRSMVEWLQGQCRLPVRHAEDGESLPGRGEACVRVAPADRHLVVRRGRLRLEEGPARNSCRPSVDELFESVARELKGTAIGCLLTGMGRDGAQGLLAMKQAGAITVAEDESSCVVFGMPREAIRLGAARYVVALPTIAPLLMNYARESDCD